MAYITDWSKAPNIDINGVGQNTFDPKALHNYRVDQLQYPFGLGVNSDLQHYVAFFINIRGKSKMYKNNKDSYFSAAQSISGQNRLSADQAGSAISKTTGALGLGATALATIGKFTSKGGYAAGKTFAKGAIGTAVAAAGAEIATKLPLLKPDQTYRLKDVITLHLEERPSVKYSAGYTNKDLGSLAGLMAGGGSATDSSKGPNSAEYAAIAAMNAAKIPGLAGFGAVKDLMSNAAKVTTNPFREVFFEAVDFRTFNFRYKFFPRDEDEVRNVQNIIRTFKYHMHPELSDGGLFYIYPSEFDITYYYRDGENTNFQKISTCVITDMQVEYGGEQFSTFRDGSPVEYTMTLTFRELETLTKDRIQEGY